MPDKFKKLFSVFLLLISVSLASYSYDITFKVEPEALAPFLSAGEKKWASLGGGAFAGFTIDLSGIVGIGPSFGGFIIPKNNSSELRDGEAKYVSFIPAGLMLDFFFYPFSRVELSIGGAAGWAIAKNGNASHFAPWYRAFADFGFRFNPKWTLGLGGSWFAYQNNTWFGNPGISGLMAGLNLKYHLEMRKKSSGAGTVECSADIPESIFPLFYAMYKENPIGSIYVKNNESAEIRNVVVKFRAQGYTSSDIECGRITRLRKHKQKELPLVADFTKEILRFTESGKIPGEIIVDYELLGQKKSWTSSVVIPVYNRNQVRWTDPQVLASYISSSAPEVLELSKVLVGIGRAHLRSGVNRNLQFAMYVFEGMRLADIKCTDDFETPYKKFHTDDSLIDYIQYPYQTLFYKNGDKDEVGILLMALLESVGISAAYVPLDDDFIVLFNTKIDSEKAERFFESDERIFDIEDSVWIPLSMNSIHEGFINSWHNAANKMNMLILAQETELPLITLSEAWQVYPSAGLTSTDNVSVHTEERKLIAAVEVDLARYASDEFGSRIGELTQMIKEGENSAENYNQLGMLYVRAGMYAEATKVYEISASLGNVTAMNNLGNIAVLQKKYLEAKKWYEKALEIDPKNASAKKNLNRVLGELE